MKKATTLRTLAILILTSATLSACATAQDKAFVDNADCKEMQNMLRMMPTSGAAIVDQWDREQDERRYSRNSENVLIQSRPDQRDSYLRKAYRKRCE